MASANIRYLGLRTRLQPLLAAYAAGISTSDEFAEAVVREIYRGLAHLSAVVVYQVDKDQLRALAAKGPVEHTTISPVAGIPGAAVTTHELIFVPERSRDARALPTAEPFVGELAIGLRHPDRPTLVLDALIAERGALGYGDRELWQWLARTLASS